MKDETNGALLRAMVECHRRDDHSLIECVSNLQRVDDAHHLDESMWVETTIYCDNWVKGSFMFVRTRNNGDFAGNGGIIEYRSGEGKYQIHT